MMENVEERIRRRAYEIWEREGRPDGREVDHWLQAAEEIRTEANGGVRTPAEPIDVTEAAAAEVPKPTRARRRAAAREATPTGDAGADAPPGSESAPLSSAPRRAPRAKSGDTSATAARTRRRRTEQP